MLVCTTLMLAPSLPSFLMAHVCVCVCVCCVDSGGR
jgi:hypothetical protein